MLRNKIINKIFFTTFVFFTLLIITTFSKDKQDNYKIINYKDNIHNIYLLNNDNYLTQVSVILNSDNKIDKVKEIIEHLKNNNKYYDSLKGIIPEYTKINDIKIIDNILYIDFNNELFNVNNEIKEKIIESLIYSLLDIDSIKGLKLSINNKEYKSDILNKNYGINKEYYLNKTNDIMKVVLYYYSIIDNNKLYVPVTKYINSKEDKIKVIIDNLRNSYLYKTNLMSYLNDRVKIIEYEKVNDILTISFDKLEDLFPKDSKEEVIWTISNSIFDSTNIEKVIFLENDNIINVSLKTN